MAASRKRRNPYTNVACQECKRRKVKCSGENPCAGCQQVQAVCLYERSTRFRASRRASMASSQSRGEASVAALSKLSEERPAGDAISSSPDGGPDRQLVEFHSQPIRPGSSDYYFNLAQQLLAGSSPAHGHDGNNSQHVHRMAQDLRKLITARSARSSQPLLAIIPLARWLEILDTYEEEIGLLYPFLDVTDIRNQLRDVSSQTPGHDSRQHIRLSVKVEEILMLVLAVVAVLEEPEVSGLGDEYAELVMLNTWRRLHTGNVTDHDVSLSILMSIYYFMTDRESLAWRNIGSVVRMLQELGYHNSADVQHRFKLRTSRDRAKKVLWSAYMLDRRWSFGTGLPFAIYDSDIDYDTDFMDESLSSAYLKAMVSYCRIAAEVRDSALGIASPNHAKDAARDLLDFKIGEWRRNLPHCLQFHPDMDFDPLKGTRGQYRLRLLLYLRANQMRIIVHRKSALRSGNETIDTSSLNAMVEVSQDTIRVLAKLTQASNIYHAQQKTFNHFLESALSALLLVTCRSRTMADRSCAAEVQLALETIDRLSTSSSITRRLADKLKCFASNAGVMESQSQKPENNETFNDTSAGLSSTSHQSLALGSPASFGRPSESASQQTKSAAEQIAIDKISPMFGPSNDLLEPTTSNVRTRSVEDKLHPSHENGARYGSLAAGLSETTQPPMLYALETGGPGILPDTIAVGSTTVDMADGLALSSEQDKWDELFSDLGEFWVDYDKMITF